MSWFYLVVLSNFLFAVIFALDKILVKKVFSALNYALLVGILEGMALILIPFVDFVLPAKLIILAAFLSGFCFVLGIYFYFKTLEKQEASWTAPLLFGVFTPIATLIFSQIILKETLAFFQIIALIFLIFGGFIISFSRNYKFSAFLYLLVAGFFIGLDFTILKIVFNNSNFWTGYTLSRLGGFLTAAFLFTMFQYRQPSIVYSNIFKNIGINNLRENIKFFKKNIKKFSSSAGLLILKQILSFTANLILIYAVSLASPTLVNGLGGVRYIFLIVLAFFLAKQWPSLMDEKLSFWIVVRKSIAVLLIIFGVLILLIQPVKTPGAKIWGADFSALYAKQLGLDYQEVLSALINDLQVKEFRLSSHWSEIEKSEGDYDFSELDYQINEIEKAGGKIILAVGKRLPRWPECHEPGWVKNQKLNIKNKKLLDYVEKIINRYKNNPAIWAWQVENEPFLWGFGECPRVDYEFLDKEIALVRNLDSPSGRRPIILTDSGEFGRWFSAYKRADIFGTTMYRKVQSKILPIGSFKYPLDPDFFRIKAAIMEGLFGKKEIINIELQAEPWLKHRAILVPLEEQFQAFDLNQFKENIEYARKVGFEKNYLWGIEWAYWLKERQNHPEFWEEARGLFSFE